MLNKLISVIVPCYNQAQYLDEVLQSVLDQTYQEWECIIINDGSSDHTEEVAKKWVEKDSRCKYVYKENGGLSSARNYGIENTTGIFILPLDADDKIAKDYIALAVQSLQEDISLKVVYSKAEKFGIEEGLWQLPPFSIYDLCRFNMIFCSAVFKRKDWELVGGYDVNMIYGLEDWEFWIAILKNGGGVKCLDEVGFYYRIRDNSMARKINQNHKSYSEIYVTKKHIEFFILNYDSLNKDRKNNFEKLRSEKYVLNLFTKMFFGYEFFKLKS